MESPLFQLSPFIQNQFQQFPKLLELLDSETWDLTKDLDQYLSDTNGLDEFKRLREFRKSRLALIAAKDEKHSSNEEFHLETLKSTSLLADLMVQKAYEITQTEFEHRYGKVIGPDGMTQEFIIFALGKLGGQELNFSSDIDLVFCYSGKGDSDGPRSIDAERYFDRFGKRVIQLLDTHTLEGKVYHVDMRLRPFGSAAPLVCSLDHLLNYLQTEGRDWERYAWLRARRIAGNKIIAQQTLTSIEPFIYRKYLDYGIFESLRQIKEQILRKQFDDEDNIKLGKGGIREIEFIIQTLQLTFGGRDQQLRGSNLWLQLQRLEGKNHLKPMDARVLRSAWLFLRKLENYCQIIDDQSRHHLPDSADLLAGAMGYKTSTELTHHWNQHRKMVHAIFRRMFLENQEDSETQAVCSSIQAIKDQISIKKLPKQSKHKLYAALDAFNVQYTHIEEELKQVVLQRYQQVIESVARRSSYLSMLIESPYVLQHLIKHLKSGSYFSKAISRSPQLLEMLFESQHDAELDFQHLWNLFSRKHQIQDEEDLLELLCQFKKRMQFLVISEFIAHHKDEKNCCLQLTCLAEFILQMVVNVTFQSLQNQNQSIGFQKNQLMIIAYGSLATQSMHLDSDIDLVFIWDGEIHAGNQKWILRWIKRIMHFLSTPSYSGQLYPLDTQLRPNGNSGTLVVTQDKFKEYQLNHAWIWELAAIVKTRCVIANRDQKLWYDELRRRILCSPREKSKVDAELKEMALKLKQHKGKSHDNEFQILGAILKHSSEHPTLIDWPNSIALLADLNLIDQTTHRQFTETQQNNLSRKLYKSLES